MRIFHVLLLVTLLPSPAPQSEEGPDYFPLQVGNTWTYLHEMKGQSETGEPLEVEDYATITITKTVEFEGKVYYYFSGEYIWTDIWYMLDRLYRKSENGNVWELSYYKYEGGGNVVVQDPIREYRLYNFSSGEKATSKVSVPAEEFDGYWFYLGDPGYEAISILLAPSIGMVYEYTDTDFGQNNKLSLVHAIVNGREYGIVSVKPSSWGRIKALFR